MSRRARLLVLAATAAVVAGTALAVLLLRSSPQAAFRNPVFASAAPDPTVIRGSDGAYYAFTTQSYHDAAFVDLPILRSTDLVHWRLVGNAMPERPAWVVEGIDNGDIWAPHITRFDGRYYLYYAARSVDPGSMGIGVRVADRPTGPYRDLGHPLVVGRGFVAIDPFAFEAADGRRYLYWGSDGDPIRVQELTHDGLHLTGRPKAILEPSDAPYEGLVEGAWVLRHGGYYYLLYSGDACCEAHAHYAVLAARSASPTGPFEKDPANPILAANHAFKAPGHNATIRDDAGRDWILYHAMVQGDATFDRYLMLDPIDWKDGWPTVNAGRGPSVRSNHTPKVRRP